MAGIQEMSSKTSPPKGKPGHLPTAATLTSFSSQLYLFLPLQAPARHLHDDMTRTIS